MIFIRSSRLASFENAHKQSVNRSRRFWNQTIVAAAPLPQHSGQKMRLHDYALALLIFGCIGDRVLPIVSSTPIPETELKVHLGGPDTKGSFGYYVSSSSGIHFGYRPLGRLKPGQTKPVTIESQGDGVVRIQWGESSDAPYAIIDTKNQRFVEDSNPMNSKNQSFAEH